MSALAKIHFTCGSLPNRYSGAECKSVIPHQYDSQQNWPTCTKSTCLFKFNIVPQYVCSGLHSHMQYIFMSILETAIFAPLKTRDYILALGSSDCIAYAFLCCVHKPTDCYIHLRFDLSHLRSVKKTSMSLPLH